MLLELYDYNVLDGSLPRRFQSRRGQARLNRALPHGHAQDPSPQMMIAGQVQERRRPPLLARIRVRRER
jgi:hypothetical protein